MAKIKTAGDLREFLAATINGVANGTFDVEKARNVTKLAQQINESFYSEIKVMKVMMEAGRESERFGSLPINHPIGNAEE